MTEEAQPSSAGDPDQRSWEAPVERQPHYHVPNYALPSESLRQPSTGAPTPTSASEPSTASEPAWTTTPEPVTEQAAAPSAGSEPYPAAGGHVRAAYPAGGHPVGGPGPAQVGHPGRGWVPPPPREAWHAPRRVETVPGTPFGTVYFDVPPMTSGLAVGALVAGIASVLVSFLVACFGLAGATEGWGGWAAGAFALLGVLSGGAAMVLGLLGLRQIRRVAPPPAIRFRGRGLAIAGLACGGTGLGVTLLAFLLALLLQAG